MPIPASDAEQQSCRCAMVTFASTALRLIGSRRPTHGGACGTYVVEAYLQTLPFQVNTSALETPTVGEPAGPPTAQASFPEGAATPLNTGYVSAVWASTFICVQTWPFHFKMTARPGPAEPVGDTGWL
jgi:hypothetical protein